MKEFIALHNRTVSRDEIQTVIALAKEQNNTEVIYRLSKILNDHPDSNRFNINIINYPQENTQQVALAGTRHSGDYREALDECGRLKKGWHFVDGKVVKVQKRSGLLSQYTEKEFGHPFTKTLKAKFKELNWKYDRKNKRYYTPVPENEAEKEQQAQMFAFIEQEKATLEVNKSEKSPKTPSDKSAPSDSSSKTYTAETFAKDLDFNTIKRSYSWISFDPDAHAERDIKQWGEMFYSLYNSLSGEAKKQGVLEKYNSAFNNGYNSLLKLEREIIATRSKTFSTAITGGAGITEKQISTNETRMRLQAEKNELWNQKYDKLHKILEKIAKNKPADLYEEGDVIKSTDNNAMTKLQQKLKMLQDRKTMLKNGVVAAKEYQKNKDLSVFKKYNIDEETTKTIVNHIDKGGKPTEKDMYKWFTMPYLNRDIKEVEKRIAILEKNQSQGEKETLIEGGKIVHNGEAQRLQIFFDGIPSKEVREALKSHAFKWAPTAKAWQRTLTENAKYAVNTLIKNGTLKSRSALAGTQHSGDYREALDDCGRLRKGWHFVDGKVVKTQPKNTPKTPTDKSAPSDSSSNKNIFLEEYRQLKAKYPEHLIIVSMEDHQNYCMYGKDAVIAANILKLQLLKLKRNDEFSISVGFKYKNLREYLEKLVKAGYKVALKELEEVETLKTQISAYQGYIDNLKDRFINPSNKDFVNPTATDYMAVKKIADDKIAEYNTKIQYYQSQLMKVYQNKQTYIKPTGQTALFGKYPEINTLAFKKMKVTELREFTLEFYRLFLKGKKKEIEKHLKEVVFTSEGGRKIAYGEAMYSAKAAVIEHLDTLIKNSTYNNWGDRKPSDSEEILGYLNFKSKITIDGKKRHVRIAISVDKDRNLKFKSYDVGKKKSVSTHKGVKPFSGGVETLSTESVAKTVPNSALSAPEIFVEHSPDPATPSITPRNNTLAAKMATLQNRTFETFIIAEPQMQAFLGDVERKNTGSTAITITGGAGSGKTRFAFQFINALAQNYKVGHASLEEQPDSKLYFDKVQQYLDETAQANVEAPEIENMQDLQALIERNDVIVIDSFTKIREWDRNFLLDRDLRKKYNGKLFLIIFQQTVAGNMRGGTTSEFDGDIILYTQVFPDYRENYIYPSKNRYNSTPREQLRYSIYHQQLLPSESTPPNSSPVTSNTYEVIY